MIEDEWGKKRALKEWLPFTEQGAKEFLSLPKYCKRDTQKIMIHPCKQSFKILRQIIEISNKA